MPWRDHDIRTDNLIGTRRCIQIRRVLFDKKCPAIGHGLGERRMPHILGVIGAEGAIAEHMIDVHMRVDHVADRFRGGVA